jgi:hypothetical protein
MARSSNDRLNVIEINLAEHLKEYNSDFRGLSERVAAIEGAKSVPAKVTHPFLVSLFGIAATAIAGYFVWLGVETHQNGKSISALTSSVEMLTNSLHAQAQKSIFRGAANGDESDFKAIPDAIEQATKSKIPIDPAVFAQTAPAIAHNAAYSENPASRAVLSAILGYRSLMNLPMLPPLVPTVYIVQNQIVPGATGIRIDGARFAGHNPGMEGFARYETIGSHVYDNGVSRDGPDVLLITGGSADVDNLHLRNIIFKQVKIIYKGGKVDFEKVWFGNCTFDVVGGPAGENFSRAILSSLGVSLQSY